MTSLPLETLTTEIASGVACGKSRIVEEGIPHLRPFSVTSDGRLTLDNAPIIPVDAVPAGRRELLPGDIIFNNTNSQELVGKSALVETALRAAFSNHITRIRVDRRRVEPGFVHRYLNYLYSRRYFEARATRWVSQAAFGTAQIKAIEVPLPPLEEQRRIVAVLDRAAAIHRRADAARAQARALIPALFLDMFGDPATNPKGWLLSAISDCADIQGGLQVTSKRSSLPEEVPYLRVANVLRGRLDLGEIKTIRLTSAEQERTTLLRGDLLVVEGHGNPNEVGRAAIWDGSIDICVHQNHLIRVRPRPEKVTSEFLCEFLNSASGRMTLIGSGKTTSGLNTISTSNVKAVRLPLPPLPLQTAFAEQAARTESVARALDTAAAKAEALAAALSAEVFD